MPLRWTDRTEKGKKEKNRRGKYTKVQEYTEYLYRSTPATQANIGVIFFPGKEQPVECLATAPRRRESVRHSNNTTRMQNGRWNVSNILEQVSQRILLYFQLYLQSSS